MATIYNSELTKEMTKAAGLQVSRESIPNQIAEKVIPVMEVNPKLLKQNDVVISGSCSNATSTTLLTTSSSKDFYITGASLSTIKDATSTSLYSAIVVTPVNSASANILSISGLTLTAQENCTSVYFTNPIKLERGSNINIVNSTNVANVSARGCIFGYYDYSPNI